MCHIRYAFVDVSDYQVHSARGLFFVSFCFAVEAWSCLPQVLVIVCVFEAHRVRAVVGFEAKHGHLFVVRHVPVGVGSGTAGRRSDMLSLLSSVFEIPSLHHLIGHG